MKILLINKFLHPRGGAETYVFQLGKALEAMGHQVQYFGMDHPERQVGNAAQSYARQMEFHGGSIWGKLAYPVKTIYSAEAAGKLSRVLADFRPDVCHLNNFHYQLTPAILLAIRRWQRQSGHPVKIIYTAHDYQLVCPNHMLRNPNTGRLCEACLGGHFGNCVKGRCIHGSFARSLVGAAEAAVWNRLGVYRALDKIICCSHFLKSKLDTNPLLAEKTVMMPNFVGVLPRQEGEKKDYVLYFGRYCEEKGVRTLLEACARLPEIPFVFAGAGPLEAAVEAVPNVRNAGFLRGGALRDLIREARFSVCPSQWYENCPFSVLESQALGTPVLAADIGGIPELMGQTGELFESGNAEALKERIENLWYSRETLERYANNCREAVFFTPERYAMDVLALYREVGAYG